MATINELKVGIDIWVRLGYGKGKVVPGEDTILAGGNEGDVSADDRAVLMDAGWRVGEFGWEIPCD